MSDAPCQGLLFSAVLQGDCGRVMVVLLTDGRANVSLAKSNRDPDALAENAPKPSTVTAWHAPVDWNRAACCAAMPSGTGIRLPRPWHLTTTRRNMRTFGWSSQRRWQQHYSAAYPLLCCRSS